jgi:hypothetical protein
LMATTTTTTIFMHRPNVIHGHISKIRHCR